MLPTSSVRRWGEEVLPCYGVTVSARCTRWKAAEGGRLRGGAGATVIIPKPSADVMLSTLHSPLSTLHFPDEPSCFSDEVRSVTVGRQPPNHNKPVISHYQ